MDEARTEPTVDWSSIAAICEQRAVALEKNDPDFFIALVHKRDREWLDHRYPVEHTSTCNLHPNYSTDPKVWARGCDCGAIARVAAERARIRP